MEPMISTAVKMTGLDLGPPPPGNRPPSSSEELLSTPKLLPPPGSADMLSPRFSTPMNHPPITSEDMLTTPVLTTPKTTEYWLNNACKKELDESKSLDEVRQPPKDLPMDSDIGLRSPCDGLLHKRRMYKLNKLQSSNSVNSDSNSCDTPSTSECSPRDLSTGPPRDTSVKTIKQETIISSEESPPPSTLSLIRDLKHRISKPPEKVAQDLHYTRSPLAVPSPNWNVVERYMGGSIGGEILKTPKLLDNSFFDFLPPPTTPKSKLNRDISPCPEYSGRDQRLSPRLSPRFPIPEAPTDLSSKSSDRNIPPPPPPPRPYPSEAEDLSMTSKESAATPSSSSIKLPMKQEYPIDVSPKIKTETEYDYRTQSFPPFYLPPQFHPALYSRQLYSEIQQRTSAAAVAASASESTTRSPHDHGSADYESGSNYVPQQPPWPQRVPWTTPEQPMEDDNSASRSPQPPPGYPKVPTIAIKPASILMSRSGTPEKPPPESKSKRRSKSKLQSGGRVTTNQPKENIGATTKRVYTCPHCQRSYDWNYNLNRHLKYECGKENAFQCAKCGRKFPHKQNCVYHLKRKHKIVCDGIDQYMTKGLVLFRGSSTAGSSQQTAN